jgi:hypothetical protein
MLLRGATKPESFLSLIHRYVTGGSGQGVPKDDGHGLFYLGGGYWRMLLWASPTSRLYDEPVSDLFGVTLVNPDRSFEEIQAVELGVAVLCQIEYKAPR